MIQRALQREIIKSLRHFPVVGILGPRQVGKTTLAKIIAEKYKKKTVYLDLELPSDVNKLSDPEMYLLQHQEELIIIDEIQLMPQLFSLIRALVDRERRNGQFLILGSASPDIIRTASETLAGRIAYHELSSLTLDEIGGKESYEKLWLRGGFPKSFLASSSVRSFEWRESFIATYLQRDIPQLGIRVPALQLRKFWTMCAHLHGQLWNASTVGKSLGVSAPTVQHYLDILHDTFILRQLQPYYANVKKRLVKSPKVYLRDSGLLHALLKNITIEDLLSNPIAGASFEGFVIEQILAFLPSTWESYFYRTGSGNEIDLVLIPPQKAPIAIEIKYSLSPSVNKGFWLSFEELRCKRGYVIYPGQETYKIRKNVSVVSVYDLKRILI